MHRHLLIIYILTSSLLSFADASPKFSEQVTIIITDENGGQPNLDSICVIVPGWKTQIATLHYSTEDFWTGPTLEKEGHKYILFTHGEIEKFKVIIYVNSKKIESNLLPRHFGNKIFELKISNAQLIDKSSFFHASWSSYIGSLFLTLFIEILLGLFFFFRHADEKTIESYLFTFILVNLITHFSLWVVYSNADIPMFFLELLVVIIESLYWWFFLKIPYSKSFLISLLTNFASWIIGAIVTIFV